MHATAQLHGTLGVLLRMREPLGLLDRLAPSAKTHLQCGHLHERVGDPRTSRAVLLLANPQATLQERLGLVQPPKTDQVRDHTRERDRHELVLRPLGPLELRDGLARELQRRRKVAPRTHARRHAVEILRNLVGVRVDGLLRLRRGAQVRLSDIQPAPGNVGRAKPIPRVAGARMRRPKVCLPDRQGLLQVLARPLELRQPHASAAKVAQRIGKRQRLLPRPAPPDAHHLLQHRRRLRHRLPAQPAARKPMQQRRTLRGMVGKLLRHRASRLHDEVIDRRDRRRVTLVLVGQLQPAGDRVERPALGLLGSAGPILRGERQSRRERKKRHESARRQRPIRMPRDRLAQRVHRAVGPRSQRTLVQIPANVLRKRGGGGVPPLRVRRKRGEQHRPQLRIQLHPHALRCDDPARTHRTDRVRKRRAQVSRPAPHHQLIQHHPERVHVGTRIHRVGLARHLLRSGERERAQKAPLLRLLRELTIWTRLLAELRDAKVENPRQRTSPRRLRRFDKDVRGLQVAVDHAAAVRVLHAVGDVGDEREPRGARKTPLLAELIQPLALDELHRHVRPGHAADLHRPGLKHLRNRRMLQERKRHALVLESAQELRRGKIGPQHLERHVPPRRVLHREIDHAHAAHAKHGADREISDGRIRLQFRSKRPG